MLMKFRNKAKISLIIIIFYLTFCASSFTQKNDYHWILGYGETNVENKIGGLWWQFGDNGSLVIEPVDLSKNVYIYANSSISNNIGNFISYTNGCSIFNSLHQIAINGDTINPGEVHNFYCDFGDYPTNFIYITKPGTDNEFILFHYKLYIDDLTADLLYSDLILDENERLITKTKNNLLKHLKFSSHLSAVRHANGRDWWIIAPIGSSNDYYILLVVPEGIESFLQEDIGFDWNGKFWGGQANFSSDGTKYIRTSPYNGLNIFDFNRCSGLLSNPGHFTSHLDSNTVSSGISTSSDSRYLYMSTTYKLYQYLLTSEDIEETRVVLDEYDGFVGSFPTLFYHMCLSPDGKIYMTTPNTEHFVHVINEPNSGGVESDFRQHAIELPRHITWYLPNVPYYRLGPEDGSACDTLGIDNIPVAHWRYDEESPEIQFTDLSYFNPSSWYWDFGDGENSELKDPVHQFQSNGTYNVCLTVRNEYGTDTECQDVTIITTSDADLEQNERIIIAPNPVGDILEIICKSHALVRLEIVGSDGVTKFNRSVTLPCKIDVSSLESGFYILIVKEANDVFMFRKIIKL